MSCYFRYSYAVWLLLSILWLGQTAAAQPVEIAVYDDMFADYTLFVHGRDLASIDFYGGKGARRDVIELVLLQQALHLGGFTEPLEFRQAKSYARTVRDIIDGSVITSAGLIWKDDIDSAASDLYISQPVVKQGEFIVGIFTLSRNTRALAAHDAKTFAPLVAVTSSQWTTDVRTLHQLGFTQIVYSPNWVNMVRMIDAGRADITLAPFQQTPDMAIIVNDITLVPVPGIKVAINGSRHWAVSRKHPQGKAFYEALERGITQLQNRGIIEKAYRECGFFNPDVANWTLLNADQAGINLNK